MGKKLVPKVILEGTRLTHKTDLAFALNEHQRFVGPRRYRYHSPLVSGEWCAFTNFPWGRGLINFDPATEEQLALDTYRTWATLFGQLRYYSWIVDRFHISTRCWQRLHHGRDYDFAWLEDLLGPGRDPGDTHVVAGIDDRLWSSTAAFCDVDGDRNLDIVQEWHYSPGDGQGGFASPVEL